MRNDSTAAVVVINETEVQPIVVRDQRVLTLAMIDKIHGRPEGTAKRNFSENKVRLTDGEDYFQVTGDEIRTQSLKGVFPPRTSKGILLTESGYLLLVKSFTDDLAWRIQKQLVQAYFRAGSPNVVGESCDTLLPSEQQTLSEIAHRKAQPYGDAQGKALAEIWSRLHNKFRIAKYSQLPRTQLADAIVYVAGMQLRLAEPAREALSKEQWAALHRGMSNAVCGWFLGGSEGNQWLHNRLRTEFNIRKLEELPAERVPEALALLADLGQKCTELNKLAMGLRDAYCREVIGAGHPWTAWVTRQLGGARMVPSNPDWRAIGQALIEQRSH